MCIHYSLLLYMLVYYICSTMEYFTTMAVACVHICIEKTAQTARYADVASLKMCLHRVITYNNCILAAHCALGTCVVQTPECRAGALFVWVIVVGVIDCVASSVLWQRHITISPSTWELFCVRPGDLEPLVVNAHALRQVTVVMFNVILI